MSRPSRPQGDRHRVMYRIVTGRVWLTWAQPDARELRYHLLEPGECLGISTLIDGEGVMHNAVARGRVQLQVLDQAGFARLRRRHPSLENAIIHSLCRDVRILSGHLAAASLAELPARVAHRLLAIARPAIRDGVLVVDLPQSELADLFGVSRQSLNKVLGGFEQDGLVGRRYGQVRLLDQDRLWQRCGSS